jgi:hypothetical protein
MKRNQLLQEEIKRHFARKTADQLNKIIADEPAGRWSTEAQAAARALLYDRETGRAKELATADDDETPQFHYDPDTLALGLLAGLITGNVLVLYSKRAEIEDVDLPQPFGRSMAWLAVETTDTMAVARQLGLRDVHETTWLDGLDAAHRGRVFVSPPVGEWTLVASTSFFHPPHSTAQNIAELLARFANWPDVQYFCNLPEIGLWVWARAKSGSVQRGYGWLGAERTTIWEKGLPTEEEELLGLRFVDAQCPLVPGDEPKSWQPANEDDLFRLASLWSIDPTNLNEELLEPMSGLLGRSSAGESSGI